MVTLTDITAMEVWSQSGLLKRLGNPYSAGGLSWSVGSMLELRQSGLEQLGIYASEKAPVHVLVDSEEHRIQSKSVVNHIWSGRVPAGSLYLLAPGVLIASPSFCCLQIASSSSLPRVASVVMECLGAYGKADTSRGFRDRGALFTPEELRNYLEGARGCMGVKKVRRALRLALFPTRSPLETKASLLLTLPRKLGGYGLPRPEVNYVIRPRAEAIPFSQFARYEVDLCWPKRKAIVEVDSYEYHTERDQLDSDAKKRNSLKSMGWKVISVTFGQLSGDALEVLARQVARDLGVSLEGPTPELRDWLVSELS